MNTMTMKKTLIALALAGSTISGSALAWDADGVGGTLEFGGTLTVPGATTPWEVELGSAVTTLDAVLPTGETTVEITLTAPLPVLGLRPSSDDAFSGATGLTPQIDFGGALDLDSFTAGAATLTVPVTDANDSSVALGTMVTTINAGAEASYLEAGSTTGVKAKLYASTSGMAFYGGLSKSTETTTGDAWTLIRTNAPANTHLHYNGQSGGRPGANLEMAFDDTSKTYSAIYGAGIPTSSMITLNLTSAPTSTVVWKAALPITISYL